MAEHNQPLKIHLKITGIFTPFYLPTQNSEENSKTGASYLMGS